MKNNEHIQKTPSVYFRFQDDSQRNLSKSSLAFDYSVSNQKMIERNIINVKTKNKLHDNNINTLIKNNNKEGGYYLQTNCNVNINRLGSPSPIRNMPSIGKQEIQNNIQIQRSQEANMNNLNNNFMILKNCCYDNYAEEQIARQSIDDESKMKTEEFFQEFQQNFVITFDEEDEVFVNEWSVTDKEENSGQSKVSIGNLKFEEFDEFQQRMKLISIQSRKDLQKAENKQIDEQKQKKQEMTNTIQIKNQSKSCKLQMKGKNQSVSQLSHSNNNQQEQNSSYEESSYADKENKRPKHQLQEFQEISFGPVPKSGVHRDPILLNSKHFMTKDFENNSSVFEKSHPLFQTKIRPLKSIENIVHNRSKSRKSQKTKKKRILNGQLLTSTINKDSKINLTNHVWSNPLNSRKTASVQGCKLNSSTLFKTNAFRQTLKSTTLQNWKKKHHLKIENLGDKKTVSKKNKNVNIFDKLFIRA